MAEFLEAQMNALRTLLAPLAVGIEEIRVDVSGLKADVAQLKTSVARIDATVARIDDRVSRMDNRLLETEARFKIRTASSKLISVCFCTPAKNRKAKNSRKQSRVRIREALEEEVDASVRPWAQ